jgi:tetratricopeptide (TPR) repeat protein
MGRYITRSLSTSREKELDMHQSMNHMKNCHRIIHGEILVDPVLLVGLLLLIVGPVAANPTAAPDLQLEQAILAEDWDMVVLLLPKEAEPNLPVPLRLVKGHACLATNRNNESLRLFVSTGKKEYLKRWDEWTTDLRNSHPHNPISGYLRGDALARLQRPSEAVDVFTASLKASPNHALLLNARGVTYCSMGQFEKALEDITKATAVAPSFTDALLSVGSLWVQWKTGPDGALEAFSAALVKSPDSIVAMNGRACAQLTLGHFEESFRDLKNAAQNGPWFTIPVVNMVDLGLMRDQLMVPLGQGYSQVKPGMSVEAMVRTIEPLNEKEARANYVKAEANRERSDLLKSVGVFLSKDLASNDPFPWPEMDDGIPYVSELREKYGTFWWLGLERERVERAEKNKGKESQAQQPSSLSAEDEAEIGVSENGRPYVIVTVDGKHIVVWISWELYRQIKDKNITVEIYEAGNITVVVLFANGEPVWEVHIGPSGQIIYRGPPKRDKEATETKGSAKRDVSVSPGIWKDLRLSPGMSPYVILIGPGGITIIPGPTPPPDSLFPPYMMCQTYGERITEIGQKNVAFWLTYKDTLARHHPEATRLTPVKGITAESLLRGYTDQGNWLTTQFGLVYPMTTPDAASTGKENKQ